MGGLVGAGGQKRAGHWVGGLVGAGGQKGAGHWVLAATPPFTPPQPAAPRRRSAHAHSALNHSSTNLDKDYDINLMVNRSEDCISEIA